MKDIVRRQNSEAICHQVSSASLPETLVPIAKALLEESGVDVSQMGQTTDRKWSQCLGRLVRYHPLKTVTVISFSRCILFP
jgi:hypothetical protein